jgi:hypothetical protein
MDIPGVSTMTTQRINRLLRSLVGVTDVRMLWRARTLSSVHILRAAGTETHQLTRNIVSGLKAGFGIRLQPGQLHIHDDAAVFEAIEVAADVLHATAADDATSAAPPAAPDRAPVNGNGSNGHRNGNGANGNGTNGNGANGNGAKHDGANGGIVYRSGPSGSGNGSDRERTDARLPASTPMRREPASADVPVVARPSSASADIIAEAAALLRDRKASAPIDGLVIERIDVDRRNGTLRCRTVLALGDHRYSAIAEVPDGPSAEAELAARVAIDALRAGGLTNVMLEGVGFITIGRTIYCVATVREAGQAAPRASAAPLIDSMAASATAAALAALGSFTDARAIRTRAGH